MESVIPNMEKAEEDLVQPGFTYFLPESRVVIILQNKSLICKNTISFS